DLSWPSATATIDADSGQLVQLTRGWHGAGSHAVVVRPTSTFTLDPSTDYLVSFWAGGAGNSTRNMPAWNAALPDLATNDAHVAGHDRFFLRLGDANGDIVQTIMRNNSYLSTRNAATTLLNQPVG